MKQQKIVDLLKKNNLFSVLSETELTELVQKSTILTFPTGQPVVAGNHLTMILSGNTTVTKNSGDKKIILRMMSAGSVSGVATLFDDRENTGSYDGCGEISVITATKKTEVLAVPADAVSFLIDTNREFRQRYILFLTSRIRFLNDRIRSYVSQGATSRLAQHLLLCDEDQSGNIELPCPASKLADMLGVGRASLYRAFDTLTGSGIIDRKGRKIMILDHCKLRSFADGAQEKASDRKKL